MKKNKFPGKPVMQWVERTFTTRTGKTATTRAKAYVFTPEQEEWLRQWFPVTENSVIMRISGLKFNTLQRWAKGLGLTKSEKGLRGIRKRTAARIKKICEANGHYDSMRGKPVNAACREGTAKMWQEIHEGKRLNPWHTLKKKNPRKYRRCMEKKSEQRKAALRKEKARLLFGLERKTRLPNVVMKPYTKRQLCHRYNAMRRGYFCMEDCSEGSGERFKIYYDEKTHRAHIFERNLIADGFKVLEWTPQ